jgi:hypothetical protein
MHGVDDNNNDDDDNDDDKNEDQNEDQNENVVHHSCDRQIIYK